MLTVGLSYMAFIMLSYVPSMSKISWEILDVEFHQNIFYIYLDDYMILISQFVNVIYHIDL